MNKIAVCVLSCLMTVNVWATDEQNRHQLEQQYKLTQQQQQEQLLSGTEVLDKIITVKNQNHVEDNEASLTQAIFIAINQQDWQDVRHYLQRYQQLKYHSPVIVYFAQGMLAKSKRDYQQAEHYFKTMLEHDIDFTRGRLELARILFENHKNEEAKQHFQAIYPQLPEQIQEVIDIYLQAIEQRFQWQGSIAVGMSYNSNVNQKSGGSQCYAQFIINGQQICTQLRTAESAVSDGLWTYNATIAKHIPLYEQHSLYFKTLAYGSIYDTESSQSQQTVNTAFGYKFQNAKQSFNLYPFYEHYRHSAQSMYDAYGLGVDYNYLPNEKIGLNLQSEYQKNYFKNHINKEHDNGDIFTTYATLSYQLSPKTLAFIGVNYADKNVNDDTHSFQQYTARVGAYHVWSNQANLTALAMFKQTNYQSENILIDPKPAKNKEQNYIVSYAMPNVNFKGFYPVLGYKYSKVKSNISWFYDYDAHEVSIKLQKMF